jgi:single-stranded DNA-binding protein
MAGGSVKLPTLNQATFVGRLSAPPERIKSQTGVAARFLVAVMSQRSRSDALTVIPCVAWGGIAETILDKLRPGAAVLVSGALSTRQASKEMFVRVSSVQFLDATADSSSDVTA